jgi:hypothetical protein
MTKSRVRTAKNSAEVTHTSAMMLTALLPVQDRIEESGGLARFEWGEHELLSTLGHLHCPKYFKSSEVKRRGNSAECDRQRMQELQERPTVPSLLYNDSHTSE